MLSPRLHLPVPDLAPNKATWLLRAASFALVITNAGLSDVAFVWRWDLRYITKQQCNRAKTLLGFNRSITMY